MVDPVRLALVGCGRIAQVAHLPAVEKAEGVELVGVSDPSGAVARSVARRRGVAAYTDQGSVWADASVEAVIVAAPDRFHHRLATEALAAGRHVLVEKPMASTVAEAEDLVGLVDRTGLTLQVGGDEAPRPGGAVRRPVHRRTPRPGALVQRLVPHRRPAPWHRGGPVPAGGRRARRPPAGGGGQGRPPALPAGHPRRPRLRHRPVPPRRGGVARRPASRPRP
jgi:Oxidoreductase family, NAD-binding Rossmann fold